MGFLEKPIKAWLDYWHGAGAPNQYQFYRCRFCQRIVTHKAIAVGGCICNNNEVIPAILRPWDKFKLLFLPWTIQRGRPDEGISDNLHGDDRAA